MNIVTRLLLKSFLGLFLLCFGSAVAIFIIIDFVGNSRVWMTRPAVDGYRYYLNYLPYIAYLICPIATLLASVFSVGVMSKHLELVALRASGVSIPRILMPLLGFGVLSSAGMFWLQDKVLPEANHRRYQINEPSSEESVGGDPRERSNFLFTGQDGTQLFFQYYTGARKEGSNVTALRLRNNRPELRVDAATLRWDSGWKFLNGTRREFYGDSVRATPFKVWKFDAFKDKPSDLLDDRAYPDEMALDELQKRIQVSVRNGESAHALATDWHFRFSSALVNFFMAIIGAALAVNTVRSGLARNFGVALLITFLYYVALRLGLVMGENGSLPPEAGAWFGNILFAPVGLWLWWRAVRV